MKKILEKIQKIPYAGSLILIIFGVLFIAIANSSFGMGKLDTGIGIMLIIWGFIYLARS